MAQKKARKRSSKWEELRGKSKEELIALLDDPVLRVPYLNDFEEQHAAKDLRIQLQSTLMTRRQVLIALANTGPAPDRIRWLQTQWKEKLRWETPDDIKNLGEGLRLIWQRPAIRLAEKVLDLWLRERPEVMGIPVGVPFTCSLGAGRLVPDQEDLRAVLIQGVFENWRHFSICANADCAAPYFIAKRKDQVVCDAEVCKAEKQRAHALKWWHENRGVKV